MKIKRTYLLIAVACLIVSGAVGLIGYSDQPSGPKQPTTTQTSEENKSASNPSSGDQADGSKQFSPTNRVANNPGTSAPQQQQSFYSLRGDIKEKDRILTKDGKVYPIRKYEALGVPNDPYGTQWWNAPNNMPAVWDIPYGSRQTKIAIIDTGFALNHQEFSGRWAVSAGEQGTTSSEAASKLNCADQQISLSKTCNNIDDDFDGIIDNETGVATRQNPSFLNCTAQAKALNKNCNRIDDDANGLIDDYRGWDFSNFDASSQAGQTNPAGSGTTHGTMVAGIAAATGNNGAGIAGVNWYSTILPIQALDDDSYGDSYTVANSIYYAADQGADVISVSLGTSADDPYMREAVQYAISKGAIVIAAAGNDGCNCMVYPANYPEVIAVGANNPQGGKSGFSSYGYELDIMAPGESMTTSTWSSSNGIDAYAGNVAGTSFATPFVSGLYALAKSHQSTARWEEITGAMFEQATKTGLSQTWPHSYQSGYGFTNAYAMLNRVRTPKHEVLRYSFSPYLNGSNKAYQCQNTLPSTPLYRLSKSGELKYTVDTMGLITAGTQGWTGNGMMYVCMALPTDTQEMLRVINLPLETSNLFIKQ